jgi:beta-N-acetylhexosaminidase
MHLSQLPLQQQVLQRLILGYNGLDYAGPTNSIFLRFIHAGGPAGVIVFRDNLQGLTPLVIAQNNARLHDTLRRNCGYTPWLAIDQEGGQVERLPHTIFPSGLGPALLGLLPIEQGNVLAKQAYDVMASHLATLGFTLNCVPTLDVNLTPQNPIIGVRSFGDNPKTVWRLAQIAMQAHQANGIMPIGKHVPGHGNGTIDSHVTLPTLQYTETEMQPFRQAMDAGIPALMVSHGYYPALQGANNAHQPATASRDIVTGFLRQQCGYEGVLITDDMCMGAIIEQGNPVQSAMASIKAGMDVLLYKQASLDEWAVLEAVTEALENGTLSMSEHLTSLQRIESARSHLPSYCVPSNQFNQFATPVVEALADQLSEHALSLWCGQHPIAPLQGRGLLVLPQRDALPHYSSDIATSAEWPDCFIEAGLTVTNTLYYHPTLWTIDPLQDHAAKLTQSNDYPVDWIVWVTTNPERSSIQQTMAQHYCRQFTNARWIIASVGFPTITLAQWLGPDYHLNDTLFQATSIEFLPLGSHRPAMMRAMARLLSP